MAIVRENEEKKRYLNGYRDCTRRERQLQEQIDALRSQQMFPSVNHDVWLYGEVRCLNYATGA